MSTCLRSFAPKRNLSPKQNTCLYWKSIKLMCVKSELLGAAAGAAKEGGSGDLDSDAKKVT